MDIIHGMSVSQIKSYLGDEHSLSEATIAFLVALFVIALPLLLSYQTILCNIKTFLAKRSIEKLIQQNATAPSNYEISGIFFYPVKSLQGISVQEHTFNDYGLENDRILMIVSSNPLPIYGKFLENDATHTFVTQRQIPTIARISTTLINSEKEGASVILSTNDKKLSVNLSKVYKKNVTHKARIWDDTVTVFDAGDEAAKFLQENIVDIPSQYQNELRLAAFQPKKSKRPLNPHFLPWNIPKTKEVALADGYPILIASETSLEDLNSKLPKPIPMSRFRPNIVIKNTGEAFEEDFWKIIQISDNIVAHVVKGCTRCKQTCTDQVTGEVFEEPLVTLGEYRSFGGEVYFCQNAILENIGGNASRSNVLKVGDKVKVLKTGDPVWNHSI